MELQCGVCLLRTWRKSDAGPIARHANDREVWLNLRDLFPHPYNTAHAVAYITTGTVQTPTMSFVIVVAVEPVGGIALRLGEDIERYSAEIGYWIGRAYWGRGIMTAAVGAVTAYAFASLGLLRVFALPFSDNAASVRVLEKAGYVRSEEHTSELQSQSNLVCRLLLEKKNALGSDAPPPRTLDGPS